MRLVKEVCGVLIALLLAYSVDALEEKKSTRTINKTTGGDNRYPPSQLNNGTPCYSIVRAYLLENA